MILVTGLRLSKRTPLPSFWRCSIWVMIEVGMEASVVPVSMGSINGWAFEK